jgi:hypothetical protein
MSDVGSGRPYWNVRRRFCADLAAAWAWIPKGADRGGDRCFDAVKATASMLNEAASKKSNCDSSDQDGKGT